MRIALIGANGGFGYSLLAGLRNIPDIEVTAVCDREAASLESLLAELGYSTAAVCRSADDMRKGNGIAIVEDYHLIPYSSASLVVEATGNPEVSTEAAGLSIKAGKDVMIVSKEADSVSGAYLDGLARQNNVRYILANGDQPKNLLDLISLVKEMGLEIVTAGKSSEYDLVFDPENEEIECRGVIRKVPGFRKFFQDSSLESILKRREILEDLCIPAPPDYCEMSLVANRTELLPDVPSFHAPILRINEIADAFSLMIDGGLIHKSGAIDVFYHIREKGEASFAGGEFVVVRCSDTHTWEMLREKGHVISKDGRYACIYHPYHLLGLEAIGTIRRIAAGTESPAAECRLSTVCCIRALRDMSAGDVLSMGGHHHVIEGSVPELLVAGEAGNSAPYYLAAGKKLARSVSKGSLIQLDDIETSDSAVFEAYLKGRS